MQVKDYEAALLLLDYRGFQHNTEMRICYYAALVEQGGMPTRIQSLSRCDLIVQDALCGAHFALITG
jgi:hypothetical protein